MCKGVKTIVLNNQIIKKRIQTKHDLYQLCEYLSDILINQYAFQMIDDIINHEYFYFTPDEQMFLKESAKENFISDNKETIYDYIQKKLYQYLSEADYLNIQGFLIFRAEQFTEYLQLTIDEVIAQYLTDLEIEELIEYLTQYLNTQKPLIETLYIVVETNHKYNVLNDMLEQILAIREYDDLLLNAIISIAPKNIYIYGNFENEKLRYILSQIFNGHITFYEYTQQLADMQRQPTI